MRKDYKIAVSPDGNLRFVYDDELVDLLEAGEPSIVRVSHVEPTFPSGWSADMSPVGGPVLGPFKLRSEALAAERAWLSVNLNL